MNAIQRPRLVRPAAALLAVMVCGAASAQPSRLPADPYESPTDGVRLFSGESHEIPGCVVGMVEKNKIDLPASEAGVLTYLGVKRGSAVKAETVLAEIDAREAEQAVIRAQNELELATRRAEDTTEIEYAEIQALAERQDWEELLQASAKVRGAATAAEIRRERLEFQRATMGGEKAKKDQDLARLEANVKRAELDASEIALEKRKVRAPFDGEVLRVHRHQGEWVQAGEPIAEIAQLGTLQVDGFVNFDDYDPREIQNCRVTIDVPVGRGRVEQATGYIVYVDPIAESLDTQSKYLVSAEVANRRVGGRWLISPNLRATMTIHLGTGGEGATVGSRTHLGRRAK